jgi:fermentation-respiration switch protein FrsA (DUF1100 family)
MAQLGLATDPDARAGVKAASTVTMLDAPRATDAAPGQRLDVEFRSGETSCAGWLYLPESARIRPVPAVAMAHGLGAVKEMHLAPFAQAIASAGVAALVFDYRYYGASGGEPRQQLLPQSQLEDYRNALTWLGLHPDIDRDRLGVWGTSFAGGHALHLGAFDPRVKAVVSQVPSVDMTRNARAVLDAETWSAMTETIAADRVRRYPDGPPQYLPVAGPAGTLALQPDDETFAWLMDAHSVLAPTWENRISVESIERMAEYTTAYNTDKISPRPLLLIIADDDAWAPPALALEAFDKALEPKRLLRLPGGHYTVYGGEGQRAAAQAAAAWFADHL